MEKDAAGAVQSSRRFLAVVLFACAVGALWLLLSPAAFERHALAERSKRLQTDVHRQWLLNLRLERWREGLEADPAVIEKEARRLGYGIPGERPYPLRREDIQAEVARLTVAREAKQSDLATAIARSILPALMLIIAGVIAMLFFTDLRVEDPGRTTADDGRRMADG